MEREGQPLLTAPSLVKSVMRAHPVVPHSREVPSPPTFELEHLDPETQDDSLFPDELTWRLYFREVHGIEAGSTIELIMALRAAGWTEDQIERFHELDLDGVIPDGTPEEREHTQALS